MYAYDGRARLQTVTHADGAKGHYAYDAADRMTSVRDENHAAPNTFYSYDPAGRLSIVRQSLAGAAGGAITTRYAYDPHGNLTSVTDQTATSLRTCTTISGRCSAACRHSPSGRQTATFEYDTKDRLVSLTDPLDRTNSFTYDAAGRPLTQTLPGGRTVDLWLETPVAAPHAAFSKWVESHASYLVIAELLDLQLRTYDSMLSPY